MAQQTTTLDAIVRAEIAIAIMNRARGLVSEREAALEAVDPCSAETLRGKRRELLAIQNSIRVDGADRIEAVISLLAPGVRDTALFWREIRAMANETKSSLLSEARNERIFRTEMLPDNLPGDIGNAECPTLIVLGGQPGSGKTAMLTAVHTELEQSGPAIRIVGDDLRSFHPDYITGQTTDPVAASRLTQTDAGFWSEKLLAAATERGVHVVFETTMERSQDAERVIAIGCDADCRIETHVPSVDPNVSWQGGHYQFEEMSHAGVADAISSRSDHDSVVSGLADSIARTVRGRLADRVIVQTDSGEKIYDNELEQEKWRSSPAARQVLEATRARPLSCEKIDGFANV